MKAMTTRRSTVDLEDAAVLCTVLGIVHEEQIAQIVKEFWGTSDVGSQELFFEDIVERAEQLGRESSGRAPAGGSSGRCGRWMPVARRGCSLPAGHGGQHR